MEATSPARWVPHAEGPEIAFFDTETTVPSRKGESYSLLEFGEILVRPRRLVEVFSYSTLIKPADLDAIWVASVRYNGESVGSAPTFADVADTVYAILHGFSGCHRYEAHQRLGVPTIRCKVQRGTKETLRY